jgi:hypothetical protein
MGSLTLNQSFSLHGRHTQLHQDAIHLVIRLSAVIMIKQFIYIVKEIPFKGKAIPVTGGEVP